MQKGRHLDSNASLSVGWDTRARTRNNRTRICCVANYTISQFSFSKLGKSTPFSELRCKGSANFTHYKIKFNFFSSHPHFFSISHPSTPPFPTKISQKIYKLTQNL